MDYKYFVLLSKLNGIALDVRGASKSEGSSIITWDKHSEKNQQWYQDPVTGTIKSRLNDFCLDSSDDGHFTLNNFQPGNKNQQWMLHEGMIVNRIDSKLVLTIEGGSSEKEIRVLAEPFRDVVYQKWDVQYSDEEANHAKPKPFYIVSLLNQLVVDIKGEEDKAGTKIIMYPRHPEPAKNQLWYVDYTGYIKSLMNNMVFTSDDSGDKLETHPYKTTSRHQWRFNENRILNGEGECLDIRGADDDEGAYLCSYRYKGDKNQHWRLDYIDFY